MRQVHGDIVKGVIADTGLAPFVVPANVTGVFREAFENYEPNVGNKWLENKSEGDIVVLDGNAVASSYLVISKDPLSLGTETVIESVGHFLMPFDIAVGLSLSQRTLGQEFSVEAVSLESTNSPSDIAIASVSQSGTVLTVNTTLPHNLSAGRRIGLRGVAESRLNYPSLVVQAVQSPTQFLCSAGPMGVIPSMTAGPVSSGFVYFRSALGFAENGAGMMFEQASPTSASFFVRSESGDVLPSNTLTGSHGLTVGSSASIQPIVSPLTYVFQPAVEYRLTAMTDKIQFSDVPVDSPNSASARLTRTQVVPDPASIYKLRIRATNNKSYTVPVAKVVSAVKTGNSTATITTDVPHGLTMLDQVLLWGQRDQTSFANTGSPVTLSSIISPTQFTVAYGASVTSATYGGFVARSNAANTALGFITQTAQSLAVFAGVISVTGSANWSGLAIGDYVNLHGARLANGADMLLDGAYRVRNINTTILELEPIGGTPVPPNLASVNCGGAIIKRTDLRISYVRVFDFERQRVEIMARPNGDNGSSVPVMVNNNLLVAGTVAPDSNVPAPVCVGGRGANVNPSPVGATGRLQHFLMTMIGATITKPFCIPEAEWTFSAALTLTTDVTVRASAGAGLRNHLTSMWAINTGASMVELIIRDGTTERLRYPLPVNIPVPVEFPTGVLTTVNTALNVALSAAGTVRVNMLGYIAP